MTDRDVDVSAAARTVASNLRRDSMTAEVLRSFEARGVQAILLKGPSVARWLFADDRSRTYSDSDLLVRPADRAAAERLLRDTGYLPPVEQDEMPEWWQEHGVPWQHPATGHLVDLHRTLPGVLVEDDRAWSLLSASRVSLDVGGFAAHTLSIPARSLHVALHATQHGPNEVVLRDLDRALELVEFDTWRQAAELAAQLQASGAMAVGLRRRPVGRELASRLGLPQSEAVELELREAMAAPEALTVEQIAVASGIRERVTIVRHKLIPPPTYMRRWSRTARRGRVGMLVAYGQRLLWVAGRAGPAVAAWARAKRRVGKP